MQNDHINMRNENYPDTDSELDEGLSADDGLLADFDSDDGPIMILSDENKGSKDSSIFITIGNTTLHIKESTFLVLTKAIQKGSKKILDL